MPKHSSWLSPHKIFINAIILLGIAIFIAGMVHWESADPVRTCCFLLLSLVASGLRMNLPQIVGTMSVSFVFVLLGILELSLSETLLMACTSAAVQALVHRQQSRVPAPPLFHVANMAIATTIAYQVYYSPWVHGTVSGGTMLSLLVAGTVLFAMNTFPVAAAYTLAEGRNLAWVWRECNFRTFPYYLAGAGVAAVFHFSSEMMGTQSPLLLVPAAFMIYCSYHSYLGRMALQKVHVEQMAALHLRTIEALAQAIEAKDMTGHNHLQRLQIYCMDLARELNIQGDELEALRAAAMLHDIGKLAVPDHVLSKPGKLSREEFEKVKIHPIVGAEILERVNFPYPVARIVRCHHEKWNGGGYPHGLKGEQIPLGARVLAAADCLDALLSDRPYRKALSKEKALKRFSSEAGVSFDPRVVQIVQRRFLELERSVEAQAEALSPGSERDKQAEIFFAPKPLPAPDDQDAVKADVDPRKLAFLDTIAAARHEAQALLELTQELGNSLHLDETLSALATGLRRLVPFDSIVIYILRDQYLIPRYASGECTSLFLSRQIPLGQGVAGWVAAHRKPVVNGNPALEMGAANGTTRTVVMNSALAVVLNGPEGVDGTLMLCRHEPDAFQKDDLRLLMEVSPKLGSVIENALKFEQMSASASTDFLTGLPNARALQHQLESELARCRRLGGALTVLVTDLDGFKEVNDRFGHIEGNAVLRAVGKALRDSCREYDYVARMGGDEFVVLLPELAEQDVALKIEQLNRAVTAAAYDAVDGANLSLSVGQVRAPQDGDDPERLLAEADQRMYAAKSLKKLRSHRGGPRGYDFDWLETSSTH